MPGKSIVAGVPAKVIRVRSHDSQEKEVDSKHYGTLI
jgi:acetyltransferase-like isoleucine patch superfamily enzyme